MSSDGDGDDVREEEREEGDRRGEVSFAPPFRRSSRVHQPPTVQEKDSPKYSVVQCGAVETYYKGYSVAPEEIYLMSDSTL